MFAALNPLLARYVVKITKRWRKLGARFWIATQNLEDFPDASHSICFLTKAPLIGNPS
jgi:hypothetical protein